MYKLMEDGISSEAIIESNREISSSASSEQSDVEDKASDGDDGFVDDLIDEDEIQSSQ